MTASEDERADVTGAESPTRQGIPGPEFHPGAGDLASGSGNGSGEPDDPVTERMPAGGGPKDPDEPGPPSADQPDGGKAKKPKKKASFWKELPILIGIALVLTFLIQ